MQSQGYADKAGAEKGITSVGKNGCNEEHFEKKEASNGKYYFVLLAANGQIIGQSQQYKTKQGRDTGIASVINNCRSETKDLTV